MLHRPILRLAAWRDLAGRGSIATGRRFVILESGRCRGDVMGKGSRVILKKRMAWMFHRCDKCDQFFAARDYYKEHIQGSFFSSLLANFRYFLFAREFCSDCYGKYGDALLKNSRLARLTGP
jgi:hypothetical protein